MPQMSTARIDEVAPEMARRPSPERTLTLKELVARGIEPQGVYVPVEQVTVDQSYYRELHEINLTNMIATGFDPIAAGALIGNRRADGLVYLLDGRHRWQCAIAHERKTVLIAVVEGLTPEEEALEYERTNSGRTDVTPAERFKAQLRRGYPPALAIRETVMTHGLTIASMASGSNGITEISAVACLWHLYELGDTALIDRVLSIITSAWPQQHGRLEATMMKTIALFLVNHEGEFDEAVLVEAMRGVYPAHLRLRANQMRTEYGTGGPTQNLYRALVTLYNEHAPRKDRLGIKGQSFASRRGWAARKLSRDDELELLRLSAEGVSTVELARQFKLSPVAVQQIKAQSVTLPLIYQQADDQRMRHTVSPASFEEPGSLDAAYRSPPSERTGG